MGRLRLHVCWFKRDLRIDDHAALDAAIRAVCEEQSVGMPACLVCLYCYEPSLLALPEHDPSHLVFVNECLRELRDALRERGGELFIRHADMPGALEEFAERFELSGLYAHEETGLWATFERDKAVRRWCRSRGVAFREFNQWGVFRPLKSRDGWASRWSRFMNADEVETPGELPSPPSDLRVGRIEPPERLGLPAPSKTEVQRGGLSRAHETLRSFLDERSPRYRTAMSSPVTAWDECSRLSPFLSYGAVSMRRVHQATEERLAQLKDLRRQSGWRLSGAAGDERIDATPGGWAQSLQSFAKRLRWHCHFIQKMEDEPEIEWRNFNSAYDGMRTEDEREWSDTEHERFAAWCAGATGYPMIDACMRCLHATGWINFRMRAMLVSFASYHLWLHWKPTARYLAKHFLDFEPGIHYSQFQMQSGTTGINTVRIYSPIKQVSDQDPTGVFIRRWLPELSELPDEHLAEPWKAPDMTQHMSGCVIGDSYPAPIVDHSRAYREAKERVYAVKRSAEAQRQAAAVQHKHGSRRGSSRGGRRGAMS